MAANVAAPAGAASFAVDSRMTFAECSCRGTILIFSVGALLSGLFLGFRDLVARKSGLIARKGLRDVRVHRGADPEGLALTGSDGPLALVIFIACVGLALFAAFCLIRGFAPGRSHSGA
jgi:hypothetical protein